MEKFKRNLLSVLIGIALAILVLQFMQPTLVNGDSMYPYLENGDYLIMNKVAYKNSNPEYGDIVVFPRDGKLLIKRVIGRPFDYIEIKDGQIYRNQKEIKDYVAEDVETTPDMTVQLGEDEYFCLGDNREVSLDSRSEEVGNVKKYEIKGKAFIRVFPRPGKV